MVLNAEEKCLRGEENIYIDDVSMSLPPCHLSHLLIHAHYTDDFV